MEVPNGGRLRPGPGLLYFHDNHFAITDEVPSRLVGGWSLSNLSRYGLVEEGFAFEVRSTSKGETQGRLTIMQICYTDRSGLTLFWLFYCWLCCSVLWPFQSSGKSPTVLLYWVFLRKPYLYKSNFCVEFAPGTLATAMLSSKWTETLSPTYWGLDLCLSK